MKIVFGIGVFFALLAVIAAAHESPAAPYAGGFAGAFLFMAFGVWLWKVLDV